MITPKSHDNRETLDDSIANFRRLENIFKAQTAKESASSRRHPSSNAPLKVKEDRLLLKDFEK